MTLPSANGIHIYAFDHNTCEFPEGEIMTSMQGVLNFFSKFSSKKSTEKARRQSEIDEKQQRSKNAKKLLSVLYQTRHSLSAEKVMNELQKIHELDGIPQFIYQDGMYKQQMFSQIITSMLYAYSLTLENALKIISMLSWDELRKATDHSPHLQILNVAERFRPEVPDSILTEYLTFLQQLYEGIDKKEYGSKHRFEVGQEIAMIKKLLSQ